MLNRMNQIGMVYFLSFYLIHKLALQAIAVMVMV